MLWGVVEVFTLPVLQNFDPGEKDKLRIPGEKVLFSTAKLKLEREMIHLELNRSASLYEIYLSSIRMYK